VMMSVSACENQKAFSQVRALAKRQVAASYLSSTPAMNRACFLAFGRVHACAHNVYAWKFAKKREC